MSSNFNWIKLVDDFEADYSVYDTDYATVYIYILTLILLQHRERWNKVLPSYKCRGATI
jgi:hypothetical protein